MVAIQRNTSKEYPCTMCGSPGNIVREDANNPRLKCLNDRCGFMYDGQDSLSMVKAGEIPSGPPEIEDVAPTEIDFQKSEDTSLLPQVSTAVRQSEQLLPLVSSLPRSPTYVLISKDRKYFEFVTSRTLHKEVLKWTAGSRKFDLFELTLKKVDARIDIN